MTTVLVLGAAGRIARHAVRLIGDLPGVQQTLYVRSASDLDDVPANARVVEGDVLDREALDAAMQGQEVVYANLTGAVDEMAEAIVASMQVAGSRRLVFVASLGVYDEVPGDFGRWNDEQLGADLEPYKAAVATIEASGLDWTILRPAWLTDGPAEEYEVTQRGEDFTGTEVSRATVARVVALVVKQPSRHSGESIGLSKPGTDGPKPSWM